MYWGDARSDPYTGVQPGYDLAVDDSVFWLFNRIGDPFFVAGNWIGGGNAIGKTYFLTAESRISFQELNSVIESTSGRKAISVHIPVGLFMGAVIFREIVHKMQRQPTLMNRHKMREIRKRFWICDGGKAREELDFNPSTSLEEGIKKTMDWYRETGWLPQ